jgi:hypothetical protein
MARTFVVVDPAVGAGPGEVAAAWTAEPGVTGDAVVESARGRVMLPGAVDVVVLPVAVNLASSALFEVVRRLVDRARASGGGPEFEVVESTDGQGNRVLVVRVRRAG